MKIDLDAIEQAARRGSLRSVPEETLALVAIARKARAFVDEQGKYVHEGELDARRYFAGDEFGALVKALEGAGL